MSSCLDIPVPRCVQHLLREPPVCMPRGEDAKVLDLIREFGLQLRCPENEIKQACHLASGGSDMVVILERPRPPSRKHNYSASFGEFVKSSPTLFAVDQLIRYGSKGARSIHTVTVLDAFIFKPCKNQKEPSNDSCHDLLEKILKLKKPKVILCCWQSEGQCFNAFVCQFMSLGISRGPLLKQVTIDHSPASAIRSLHPASAVYHDLEQKAYGQMLLVCHFVLAFTLLWGSVEVPDWMEVIRRGSGTESQGIKPQLTVDFERETKGLVRTAYILQMLRRMTNASPSKLCVQKTENETARQQRYEINHLLSQLFASKYEDGSLEVARLCLLWKKYNHPRKEMVISRLIDLGSAQNWFQSPRSPEYLDPVTVEGRNVGLAEEDEGGGTDVALAAEMGFLRLQGSSIPNCSTYEENAILAKHHKTLAEQTMQLQMMGPKAAQLAKFVALAVDLQATKNGSCVERLVIDIATFAQDQYVMLQNIAVVIGVVPSTLLGDTDLIINKERPLQVIIHRPEIRVILDKIRVEVELVVHLTISFVLQFSGLVAQGKILYSASGLGDDEVGDILVNPPLEFGDYVQKLRGSVTSSF